MGELHIQILVYYVYMYINTEYLCLYEETVYMQTEQNYEQKKHYIIKTLKTLLLVTLARTFNTQLTL